MIFDERAIVGENRSAADERAHLVCARSVPTAQHVGAREANGIERRARRRIPSQPLERAGSRSAAAAWSRP